MKRLAVVTTHPIQYYAPVFKQLSAFFELKVFYTWGKEAIENKYDPGFNKIVNWDLPLLDGYESVFLQNSAEKPGSHHFHGIKNPDIIKWICAFNPESILVIGWSYSSHLQVMRYFKGKVPILFRGDSHLLDKQAGIKKIARHVLLKLIYRYIDFALYVGTANKAYYLSYGVDEERLIFAPHAIDNGRFAEDKTIDSQKIRKDLGLVKDDMLILFAGKLEPKKNPDLLLRAFDDLNHPEVHLLFVGNGVLEGELKLKALNLNSSGRIHFKDFENQTNMPAIYQSCDLFCLPSNGPGETWGLAVNEAMAAGKAILVSDKVGCAYDLVIEGKNGAVFKSNDKSDLIETLKQLLKKDILFKMGEESKQIIHFWTFDAQVEAIRNALNNGK